MLRRLVWPWKMVSVSVRYLFYQPVEEKIKTWTLRFPAKENPNMGRACSIGQLCCSMRSKQSIDWFPERSSGMKFFQPSIRLTNQKPRAFVSVHQTNKIILLPFICRFCFVCMFSFQGHTKSALLRGENSCWSPLGLKPWPWFRQDILFFKLIHFPFV